MTQIKPRHFVTVLVLASMLHVGIILGLPYILTPVSEDSEETLNITFAAPPVPPAAPPQTLPPKASPPKVAKVVQPTPKEFEKLQLDEPVDEEPIEESEPFGVPGGPPGPSDNVDLSGMGNVIVSQFALQRQPLPPVEPPRQDPIPPPPPPPKHQRISGEVQEARLVHRVQPIYPPMARRARLERTVLLRVVIGVGGDVRSVKIVRGHPLLDDAAIIAVRQWRYTPMLVNERPVEFTTEVAVQFHLQ